MPLATKLAQLRKDKKQSLQAVADSIKVSKGLIWELEKGRIANPSVEVVSNLAAHFGVTLEWLLDDSRTDPKDTSYEEDALIFYKDFKQLDDKTQEILREHIRLHRREIAKEKDKKGT